MIKCVCLVDQERFVLRDNLTTLEQQCRHIYESRSEVERNQAQDVILGLVNQSDCLNICQLLLERASSPYAQLVASKTLFKLLDRRDLTLSVSDRLDIRLYVLNYVLQRRQTLEPFVQKSLIHLFCRLTKLGWFDFTDAHNTWPFRDVVEKMNELLETGRGEMALIALNILSSLVNEISEPGEIESSRSLASYRKTINSFRETALLDVFRISCQLLKDAMANINNTSIAEQERVVLLQHILNLFHDCLNYDFIGNATDEANDDMISVQIPTSWKTHFNTQDTVDILFSIYHSPLPGLASSALNCLVLVASIRRSLFTNDERNRFLERLVQGVLQVMERPQALFSDIQCYHDFCRLVARLKTNFQLSELIKVPQYSDCVRMLTQFTVQSLQSSQMDNNSLHYLLILWQRMVASVPYVRSNEPHFLEQLAPEVLKAYVQSRLNLIPALIEALLQHDSLGAGSSPVTTAANGERFSSHSMTQLLLLSTTEDEESEVFHQTTLVQQMEQIAIIGRANYDDTCQLLVKLFQQSASEYQEVLVQMNGLYSQDGILIQRLTLQQYRLAWLVYIMGAVISGRTSFASSDEHDCMDGYMAAQVIQLLQLTDWPWRQQQQQAGSRGADSVSGPIHFAVLRARQRLELSLLTFMDYFRKIYIGDSIIRTTQVYLKLIELLNINDEVVLLQVFLNKILHNLKFWCYSEPILSKTLALLNEFSVGHNTVRKMQRLEAMSFLLSYHSGEHFPFLGLPVNVNEWHSWQNYTKTYRSIMKYRTNFYTALGRILLTDFGEDEDKFYAFMQPLTLSLEKIAAWMMDSNHTMMNEMELKLLVIGLCRDLRGLAQAFTNKNAFILLFDWFYPGYASVIIRVLHSWSNEYALCLPILHLFEEMALNRSNRLSFEVSSPNGLLLFRETSHVLRMFGEHLLNQQSLLPGENKGDRQKATATCFSLMKAALTGGYAHFGTFSLYGDRSLDSAVEMFVKLLFSMSKSDLMQYPKLSVEYFSLLETLTTNHIMFIGLLSLDALEYLFATLAEGLNSLNALISSNCCHGLDEILTHMFTVYCKTIPRSLSSTPAVSQTGNGSTTTVNTSPSPNASISPLLFSGNTAVATADEIVEASKATKQRVLYRRHKALEMIVTSQGAPGSTPGAISNGCNSLNSAVATNTGLDYQLACNLMQLWQRQADADKLLLSLLQERPAILQQIACGMLHTLMYEECRTQWSISRPFFCLFLLLPQYMQQLQEQIINSQLIDRREGVRACFAKLGDGLSQTLTSRDRDKFTQNVSIFRRDITECLRAEMGVGNGTNVSLLTQRDDMMG